MSQLINAVLAISVIPSGIRMLSKSVLENADSPIQVKPSGNVMLLSSETALNAELPIFVTLSGMTIEEKQQNENASLGIVVIPLGIFTDSNDIQFEKTLEPNSVMLSGKYTSRIFLQSSKALSPI
nr:hypothetical protein [uncultured Intestinimonas sp.]